MQSGTNFAVSSPFFKSRRREKCFDLGTNRHRESLWCESFRRSPPSRHFNASSSRAYLLYSLIYTLSTLPILSVLLSSHFSAPSPRCSFSAPPLAQPSLPSLSLPSLLLIRPIRTLRPIRAIRVQKKIILVQKKFLSASCAKSPSKLSPSLYKLRAKHSAIPLKSRKTQIFSNFLSQSLARFRKSPYFCTR